MRPAKFQIVSALVLSGLFAMASAQTIEPSGISFKVSGSPDFPILDTGADSILEYDLSADRIDFKVGTTESYDDPLLSYDNPFFCFDFSNPDSAAVTLNATDANGHVVMDEVGLASELSYNLVDTISFSPSSSVQCFYNVDDGNGGKTFGPFGEDPIATRESDNNDPDVFFRDRFAAYPEVNIEFTNLRINDPEAFEGVEFDGVSVSPQDVVTYDLVITNSGDGVAESLSFQEVFPASDVFGASLSGGNWVCFVMPVPAGADVPVSGECPAQSGNEPIRFEDVTLPAGEQLIFEITREVVVGSEGQINLYAGLVNGAGARVESAAANATLGIVGEAVSMAFSTQPSDTTSGNFILTESGDAIVVRVEDANNLLVPDFNSTSVTINLIDSNNSRVGALAENVQVVDGKVEFTNLSTEGYQPAQGYKLEALPSDLSLNSGLSNSFNIN